MRGDRDATVRSRKGELVEKEITVVPPVDGQSGQQPSVTIWYKAYLTKEKRIPLGILALALLALLLPLLAYQGLKGRHSNGVTSSFFKTFTDSTAGIFQQINNVDLPSSDAITQHTVACRFAANVVEESPAFAEFGPRMAESLRGFGDKVRAAGSALGTMYRKGSAVFETFDLEVRDMFRKLRDGPGHTDGSYISSRMQILLECVARYRDKVKVAQDAVRDAEEARNTAEGYLIRGRREARAYATNNGLPAPKGGEAAVEPKENAVDLGVYEELDVVDRTLRHMDATAKRLDRVDKILSEYEDRLLDVQARLAKEGKAMPITQTDLKHLWRAVELLRQGHAEFLRKDRATQPIDEKA